MILDLLAKLLGPNRAVSAYVFLQRWGIGIGLFVGFVIVLAGVMVFSSPEKLEHVAYFRADVIEKRELNNGAAFLVTLALPEGGSVELTEAEGAISATIAETACLEKRAYSESGALQYRFRMPHRCDG